MPALLFKKQGERAYFFLTRDPPELRPLLPELRPALVALPEDRGAEPLLPEVLATRGVLVRRVVVLRIRPELEVVRPDLARPAVDLVVRDEGCRMLRVVGAMRRAVGLIARDPVRALLDEESTASAFARDRRLPEPPSRPARVFLVIVVRPVRGEYPQYPP